MKGMRFDFDSARARAKILAGLVGMFLLGAACLPAAPPTAPEEPATPTQPATPTEEAAEAPPAPTPTEAAQVGEAEPRRGGTFVIGQDFGPQSLDPHKNFAWASINIYESIYNGLVQWNEDETELLPDLATEWDISDDELVYTFKIRQGVNFHNGREMTVEDVKFSIDRLRDPDVSVHAANYRVVESVEVVDDETVRITLERPLATLLMFLTDRYPVVPSEAVDQLETNPIGTGPFMFEELVVDQQVRLVRNPDYFEDGLPYLDEVVFRILGDEASKESALRTKALDMTWFREPVQAESIANDLQGIVSAPGIPSRYIPIRLSECEPPFDDVRVRRALSLAMDREALIEIVIPEKYGGAVSSVVPPSSRFYLDGDPMNLPYYRRDVDQAKALLAEAGYPDGITVDAYKVVAANQLDVDAAQVLKQQWAEAGINVNIVPMEVGQILADWREGNGKMIQVGLVWAADPDVELYSWLHSTAEIAQAYCIDDPVLDDILDRGRTEVDVDVRHQTYQELQEGMADQAHQIVLYSYPLRWEMWWDHVKGYQARPSNSRWDLRYMWLER